MIEDEIAQLNSILAQLEVSRSLRIEMERSYAKMEHDVRNQLQIKMFEKHQANRKAQTQDSELHQKPDK